MPLLGQSGKDVFRPTASPILPGKVTLAASIRACCNSSKPTAVYAEIKYGTAASVHEINSLVACTSCLASFEKCWSAWCHSFRLMDSPSGSDKQCPLPNVVLLGDFAIIASSPGQVDAWSVGHVSAHQVILQKHGVLSCSNECKMLRAVQFERCRHDKCTLKSHVTSAPGGRVTCIPQNLFPSHHDNIRCFDAFCIHPMAEKRSTN